MILDQNDFRCFEGEFYSQVPTDLVINRVGHKRVHFSGTNDLISGAFVYMNTERRAFLHSQQYPETFDLVAWLTDHPSVKLLVTEKPILALKDKLPQFIVPNTWNFYKAVAAYIRQRYFGEVVTVTGSVGKSTTRLMIVKILTALQQQVVTNVGNENVRQVAVPLLTTTMQNPDALVAELSINALNNRDKESGPVSRLYRATAAVITQIGGAHLAELDQVSDPLMFLAERKTRIFEGLDKSSRAIINYDMTPRIYKYVIRRAQQQTEKIYNYSLCDEHADAYVLSQRDFRDYTELTIQVLDETKRVQLSMPGSGVISDLLAACVTVKSLGLKLPDLTTLFMGFEALNSELRFQKTSAVHGKITVVDDTHGSTLHSVDNVLSVFKERGKFYRGKKVLIMETGEDLGKQAATYNLQFEKSIISSGIDILLGYRDDDIKVLVDALSGKIETDFYTDLSAINQVIQELPDDSLVIIKSSDGRKYGSDLWKLPEKVGQIER
ncbi:Mur ligase family protein [Lactiplantibacillus pingfangensis]|uniref:Mur ligase family protein n=1 Tax=Lactiplantibacillus pingfangensis TaxID=2559915 RepID=UPI0010F5B5F2|nr:Mur ligase family protein [Lactiplantibacillus pingfangensis]